jgi:GNAT superfamily N-acetyltransferase
VSAAVVLRRAEPADAAVVHRFISELAAYEREPDAVEVTVETLASQIGSEHPPFECLVAEVGGEAAGFALFFQTYSTWRGRPGLWLEDLYVTPSHRGRGVGVRLFEAVRAIARERGYARFELAVLEWNELAIERYRRWGGEPLDGWSTWRFTP